MGDHEACNRTANDSRTNPVRRREQSGVGSTGGAGTSMDGAAVGHRNVFGSVAIVIDAVDAPRRRRTEKVMVELARHLIGRSKKFGDWCGNPNYLMVMRQQSVGRSHEKERHHEDQRESNDE